MRGAALWAPAPVATQKSIILSWLGSRWVAGGAVSMNCDDRRPGGTGRRRLQLVFCASGVAPENPRRVGLGWAGPKRRHGATRERAATVVLAQAWRDRRPRRRSEKYQNFSPPPAARPPAWFGGAKRESEFTQTQGRLARANKSSRPAR